MFNCGERQKGGKAHTHIRARRGHNVTEGELLPVFGVVDRWRAHSKTFACGQNFFCIQLYADEANEFIQWKWPISLIYVQKPLITVTAAISNSRARARETPTSQGSLEDLSILRDAIKCHGHSDMTSWRNSTVTLLCWWKRQLASHVTLLIETKQDKRLISSTVESADLKSNLSP